MAKLFKTHFFVLVNLCVYIDPDPGAQRFNFSFTIRDSPSDYVNVTCWGTEMHIKTIFQSFKICDVGKL